MIDIVCERCGSDEHLRGRPVGELIELRCDACEHTSIRDPRPACPVCGGRDLEAAPKLLVEKSRGSQMSIQGVQREFLCRTCDADVLAARRDGYLPDRLGGSQ